MPAAAVRQEERALFSLIGRKGYVGGQSKYQVEIQGLDLVGGLLQLIDWSSEDVGENCPRSVKILGYG